MWTIWPSCKPVEGVIVTVCAGAVVAVAAEVVVAATVVVVASVAGAAVVLADLLLLLPHAETSSNTAARVPPARMADRMVECPPLDMATSSVATTCIEHVVPH